MQETPANEEDDEGAERDDDMDTNTKAEEKEEKEKEEGDGEEGAEAPEEKEEKPTSELRRLEAKNEDPTGQEGDTAQDVGVEMNKDEKSASGEMDTEMQVETNAGLFSII